MTRISLCVPFWYKFSFSSRGEFMASKNVHRQSSRKCIAAETFPLLLQQVRSRLWQMEKDISDKVRNFEAAKDNIIEVGQESRAASDMVNVMRLLKP